MFIYICLIFCSPVNSGTFSNEWRIASIVPVHKAISKQLVENYSPLPLLPMYSKTLES